MARARVISTGHIEVKEVAAVLQGLLLWTLELSLVSFRAMNDEDDDADDADDGCGWRGRRR